MEKDKYKKLTFDTILFAIGSFGTKLLSFILVPLYTNYLSREGFGTADLLTTTASLLCYIVTLNISEAVLRFAIDEKNREYKESVLNVAIKIIFIGNIILMFLLICIYKIQILSWPAYYYFFILLLCLVTAMKNTFLNYLRALDMITNYVRVSIVGSFSYFAMNIYLLVYLHKDLFGYLLASVLGELISILMIICMLKRKGMFIHIRKRKYLKLQHDMLRYSAPLAVNSIGWWINNCIDKYFIAAQCGVAANGIYAAAGKIPSLLTVIQGIFAQAWTLSAIKEYNNDDTDEYYSLIYSYYFKFSLIACSLLIIFNKLLSQLLFSQDFYEARYYSTILLISILFSGLSANIGSVFIAAKDSKIFSQSTVCGAITNIILNAFLIPKWGIYGAAWATVCSFFVMWLMRIINVKKYTKARYLRVKDVIAFLVLMLQVYLEQKSISSYSIQFFIFAAIIFLYKKDLKRLFIRSTDEYNS